MPPAMPTGAPAEDALKNFTNRESERAVLKRVLDLPTGRQLPVVMFYGVGGAGKSWLIRKLRQELGVEKPFLPTALLDFNPYSGGIAYHTNAASSLANLRQQFSEHAFPRFDLAFAWLKYHESKLTAAPEAQYVGPAGELAGIVKEGANAVEGVPGLGVAVEKIGKWLGRRFKGSKWEEKLLSDDFKHLKGMDAQTIYGELTDRFLADAAEQLHQQVGHACRAVIFLDTYEAVSSSVTNAALRAGRERWIRALHRKGSPLLLVLAGRDKLTWAEDDGDYTKTEYLEQHLVGGLSPQDATKFLTKCEIEAGPLQAAILRVSIDTESETAVGQPRGYHPFCLNLATETVKNITQAGGAIDPGTFDFEPGDIKRIARRFLTSLPDQAYAVWVTHLAYTPRFDERAARAAYSPVADAAQTAAWQTLSGFSFVQVADEPGWFTLHAKMRDVLADDPTATADHTFWRDHWESRSSHETDDCASLAWYHGYCLDPKRGLKTWNTLAKKLRGPTMQMAEHLAVLDWWEPTDIFQADTETVAAALNDLGIEYRNASLGDCGENLARAVGCFEAALRGRTEDRFPQDWAMTQNNLGNAYGNLPTGDRGENLARAVGCFEAALRVYTEERFPQQWGTIQNNLGNAYGNLPTGDRGENLARAVGCFEAALRVRTEGRFPQQWAMTQNNLGNVYGSLPTGDRGENLARAVGCYEAALRVRTEGRFPQDWAMTQNNLGNVYTDLLTGDRGENLARAVGCFEAALRVYTEERFPQDWAMTQDNLGLAYRLLPTEDRGVNLTRAIGYFEAALRIRIEDRYPQDWAETQFNLALTYAELAAIRDVDANRAKALQCMTHAVRGFASCGHEHYLAHAESALAEWKQEWGE